jgi:CxxC motif-containing protein
MTELICIVCPRGCHLNVDEAHGYAVSGEGCKRGIEYGKAELRNPVRVLSSTVPIIGAMYRSCPVKTSAPIP